MENSQSQPVRGGRRKNCNGFTLIEVLFAVILVGLSVAGLTGASFAYSKSNGAAVDLATAEYLMEQIRELTVSLPVVDPQTSTTTFGPESGETALAAYDDVDDLDGTGTAWRSFSPPIDAGRNSLANFSAFTQQIKVQSVSTSDLSTVATDHSTSLYRVSVQVLKGNRVVTSGSWIRTR